MSENIQYLVFAGSYLLGSFPTAYIVGKLKNIDIRKVGSGNVGATNTARILGKKWAMLVLGMDILKGLVAVLIAKRLLGFDSSSMISVLTAGLISVLGHIFPIWLNFKGGKGVATVCGVVIALSPFQALIAFGVFASVLYLTRFVSLSSLLGGISLPCSFFLFYNFSENAVLFYFFTGLSIILIVMHTKNIRRLLSGKESKISSFAR